MRSSGEKSTHIRVTKRVQSVSHPHTSISIKYCRLLTIRYQSYNCGYNKSNMNKQQTVI